MLQRPRPTVAGESMPLLLRTLLWCYPREFRTAYARDLTNFVVHQRREPRYRRLGIVRFWMHVVSDAMMSGLRMRWRSLYGRRRSPHGPHCSRGRSVDVAGLLHDIRIGARSLLRSPTYTAVAVVTLALGIGATTAIFSVVHSVILRPLPYPHADELVAVWRTGENVIRGALSYPDFDDWRVQNTSFEEINKVRERESAAFLRGDADSYVALFTDDAVVMPPSGSPIRGHAALRSWLQDVHDQSAFAGGEIRSLATIPVLGWAWELYEAKRTLAPKAGGEAVEERYRGMHIYQRQPDGTWRIAQDIWNAVMPGGGDR